LERKGHELKVLVDKNLSLFSRNNVKISGKAACFKVFFLILLEVKHIKTLALLFGCKSCVKNEVTDRQRLPTDLGVQRNTELTLQAQHYRNRCHITQLFVATKSIEVSRLAGKWKLKIDFKYVFSFLVF